MQHNVVTIQIDAVVDGKKLDVQEASIVLGVNAIPYISLMVAPSEAKSSSPLKPNVFKPVISDFLGLYQELSEAAKGRNKYGDVNIVVQANSGSNTKKETLSLKQWVLANVGMSGVSAESAPYLNVVLEHPICHLTKVGAIYEEPKSTMSIDVAIATASKRSLLDIMSAVYELVRTKDDLFYKAPSSIPEMWRKKLGVDECDPNKYLHESVKKLFLEAEMQTAKSRLAVAIGRMVLPMDGASSTWDVLMHLCGALVLQIVQDETYNFTKQQLLLEPAKPFKSPTITLDEQDCFSTDVPSDDPFRIVGVMARKVTVTIADITLGMFRNGNANQSDLIFDSIYVPSGVHPTMADGRIVKTSAPVVLAQAMMEDAQDGSNISSAKIMAAHTLLTAGNNALEKYCQAVFETAVGSRVTARAHMALWFKDRTGKWILPGNTCKFVSQNKPIYYGYIETVVHRMSIGGNCSTTVHMSRVRPGPQWMMGGVVAVPNGNVNAVYDA